MLTAECSLSCKIPQNPPKIGGLKSAGAHNFLQFGIHPLLATLLLHILQLDYSFPKTNLCPAGNITRKEKMGIARYP